MNKQINDSVDGGPVYEDCLPLMWETFETKPSPAEIAVIHNSNEEILKAIYVLGEGYVEIEDAHNTLAQQVMRMDAKISFLMDMVGQLLAKSLIIPESRAVSLSSTGMEWVDTHAPEINAYIHVQLYLKLKYPKPVILPAVVTSVADSSLDSSLDFLLEKSAQEFKIAVSFESLSASFEEWLERLIFRHHRRLIALSRR